MIRLNTQDAGFAAAFDELVDARRESDADVARDVQVILRAVRDDGEAAVAAFTRQFDGHDLTETGWRIEPADCRAAYEALEPELRAALDLAAAHPRLSRKAEADRHRLCRCAGRSPRRTLDGGGCGRNLCSRRAGGLSLLAADERDSRQGGGRRAAGDGHADAEGRDQPSGPRRRASGGRGRGVARRRRAGCGRAGLWCRSHPAGRCRDRPGQCLGRGGQAAGVRHGRHRHGGGPVRDRRRRGRPQRSRLDRRRPAEPGRA